MLDWLKQNAEQARSKLTAEVSKFKNLSTTRKRPWSAKSRPNWA